MKEGFRQSMAWMHSWAGLLLGWLLFFMFVSGTSAYFQHEITRWMQPEVVAAPNQDSAVAQAIAHLNKVAPDAQNWFITPPSSREATTSVFWQPKPIEGETPARRRRGENSATLDGQGQPVTSRETRGGFFLYRLHFDLHYIGALNARYIVGVAAMLMLIAIFSGIVTHKKIFADFFMLRFGKGQRSWLDAHNVTAVFALPFHLMITYTGLVSLATMYMPWGIAANYAQPDKFFEAIFPDGPKREAAGTVAKLAPITPLMDAARQALGKPDIGRVQISNPNDANALVTFFSSAETSFGIRGASVHFDGATGAPLGGSPQAGAAATTESVMVGIHAGRFAGWGLRWLYFLSGVGGTIMVGTGLLLWIVKRRTKLPDPQKPHFGFRLVERLNIGFICGTPAGYAAYFLANRLLPVGMEGRAAWEIHSLFIALGAMLVWAAARPPARAWVECLWITAGLFALIPVVNAITTPRNMFHSLLHGDWIFLSFDSAMLILAAIFAMAARKLMTRPTSAPRRSRKAMPEALPI